ncbi:RHS repeat domain-containing protein, partial [Tahibacter harae]
STTTTSYRYDANDRLLDETAVSNGMTRLTTHRYDLNGSLVETIAPDATTRYRYDGRNKLAQVERQVGSVLDITQYTYTHDGIRRSQIQKASTLDAKEVRYLIDPNQAYAQVIEERVGAPLAPGASVSGLSLKAAYTYGDDLLGQYALRDMQGNLLPNVGAPSGTPNPVAVASTFHYDGLGSTRLLTDAAGSPVDRYAYHAFGDRDEWASELAAGQNPATDYQYTGEQFDPNLGFYYLRARYMDPSSGRFTQQDNFSGFDADPISIHKYLYANANGANYLDPSGMATLIDATAANNVMGTLLSRAIGVMNTVHKVQSAVSTIQALAEALRVLTDPGMLANLNGYLRPAEFSGNLSPQGFERGLHALKANARKLVSSIVTYKINTFKHFLADSSSNIVFYLPTPGLAFKPGRSDLLPTPVRIPLANFGSRRLVLGVGGHRTRFFGIGFSKGKKLAAQDQLFRMDWAVAGGHTNGPRYWQDSGFEFHIPEGSIQ